MGEKLYDKSLKRFLYKRYKQKKKKQEKDEDTNIKVVNVFLLVNEKNNQITLVKSYLPCFINYEG